MKRVNLRKADLDGLVSIHGVIYQVPLEFAGRLLRVDADAREFDLYRPEPVTGYPLLKKASAGSLG